MHPVPSPLKGRLALAAAAALALAASGCAAPSAEKSSAAGSADRAAAGAGPGSQSGAKGREPSWWRRLTQSHREPGEQPWVYGDVRPGKGLLSNDEDGFVLLRQGEGAGSPDPAKPAKVRR